MLVVWWVVFAKETIGFLALQLTPLSAEKRFETAETNLVARRTGWRHAKVPVGVVGNGLSGDFWAQLPRQRFETSTAVVSQKPSCPQVQRVTSIRFMIHTVEYTRII